MNLKSAMHLIFLISKIGRLLVKLAVFELCVSYERDLWHSVDASDWLTHVNSSPLIVQTLINTESM